MLNAQNYCNSTKSGPSKKLDNRYSVQKSRIYAFLEY